VIVWAEAIGETMITDKIAGIQPAQELKTAIPVSKKRFDQKIKEIERMV
jgi:hypothetical protein